MIICAISDTHCRKPVLPKADLLIHAGDLGGRGDAEELSVQLRWLKGLLPQYPLGIIYVPGNHDIALDAALYEERWNNWDKDPYHSYRPSGIGPGRLLKDFKEAGITVLIDQPIEVEGFKIYGTPRTPVFMNWAFMTSEHKLADYFQKIPDDTQILISHGPAQGLRDLCSDGHVGSSALRYAIDSRLPDLKAHIFGHIHEGAGHHQEGRYQSWNAAVLDGNYWGFNEIHTLDTETWNFNQILDKTP